MKFKIISSSLALSLALTATAPLAAQSVVYPAIRAALTDSARPPSDVARDSARYPGEMLSFAGITPGMKLGDFMMGSGYFTRILAKSVGDNGHVYAYQAAEFISFRAAYAEEQAAVVQDYDNVTALNMALGDIAFPEPLDVIVTVQNYHDLHLGMMAPDFAKTVMQRLYDALKPGGILLVADHVAMGDPDFAAPNVIHRIDPVAARAEIESVGFQYIGESNLLRNSTDPHTTNVFEPSIRGKSDQFIMLFRKPA